MINFEKNLTGTKMLMVIGMVNAFLLSGKLRTRGNFPLSELMAENAREGGDLQKLIVEIAKAAGTTGSLGIDFDLSDQDIQEFMEDTFSIKELPAGSMEISINGKSSTPSKPGKVSLGIKVSFDDEAYSPSLGLSLDLYGNQITKIIPVLKNQFLAQGRISELVNVIAYDKFQKEALANTPESDFKGRLQYISNLKTLMSDFRSKSKEELWDLAEKTLVPMFTKTGKINDFSLVFGIFITDKSTLFVDFKQKVTKKKS